MTKRQIAPLVLLVLVLALQGLAIIGVLPPGAILLELVTTVLAASVILVGTCALIENTVAVNTLFPGAVAVLYGMAATQGDVHRAAQVFIVIVLASLAGQNLSFLMGRLASRGASMVPRLMANSPVPSTRARRATFLAATLAYWHPTIGAAYSYSLGANDISYRGFISVYLVVGVAWTFGWGVSMFLLGSVPISGDSMYELFVVGLVIWLVVETARSRRLAAAIPKSGEDV